MKENGALLIIFTSTVQHLPIKALDFSDFMFIKSVKSLSWLSVLYRSHLYTLAVFTHSALAFLHFWIIHLSTRMKLGV